MKGPEHVSTTCTFTKLKGLSVSSRFLHSLRAQSVPSQSVHTSKLSSCGHAGRSYLVQLQCSCNGKSCGRVLQWTYILGSQGLHMYSTWSREFAALAAFSMSEMRVLFASLEGPWPPRRRGDGPGHL